MSSATQENPKRVLRPAEVAEQLAVSVRTVNRLARRGELPSLKYTKGRRYRQADIDAFLFKKREKVRTRE